MPLTGPAAAVGTPICVSHKQSLMNRTMPGYVTSAGAMPASTSGGEATCVNGNYTSGEVHVPCLDAKQVCLLWAYIAFMSRYTTATCLHDVLAAVCTPDCNSSTAVAGT